MRTASKKLTNKIVFTQTLVPILAFLFLLFTYSLATKNAFIWIYDELEAPVFIFSLFALTMGCIALIWKFGRPEKHISAVAMCLILSSGLLSILTFSVLQQLSASFALLGTYGFFASFHRVSPTFWRKGLIMAGLAALALPFALVPGTGMGFYLRLLTADAAAQLLAIIGHSSLGAHDVLIFDNGIAQVDLPCSGLKSLFTGTGFFFIASLLLRREVNFKWMMGYGIFAALLVIANAFRVTILIWVSEILQHREIAESIHMPLGLMLFCMVCLCGIYILFKLQPFNREDSSHNTPESSSNFKGAALSTCVGFLFLGSTLFLSQNAYNVPLRVTLPNIINVETVALTPTETRFFGARDQTSAKKWLFKYQDLSGSMLVVRSGAANGLHAPEVCMLGNGISVDQMHTREFNAGNYRYLTVDKEQRNAIYWMQSERIITDDFRKRLNNFILGGQDDWVMVTILFDNRLNLATSSENKTSVENLMLALQSHFSAEIHRKQDPHAPS